jgi:imidazolonepropionase-like amidohydrolase
MYVLSSFRIALVLWPVLGLMLFPLSGVHAQQAAAPVAQEPTPATLFENVRIFDGVSDDLSGPLNVLVSAGRIQKIDVEAIVPPAGQRLLRIDGTGRVLMPGMIDAHVHLSLATASIDTLLSPDTDQNVMAQQMARTAEETLMRGFTSVRDLAGPVFDLKRAVDAGDVPGPRIYPSGAMISQTGGHGDYRSVADLPRAPYTPLSPAEIQGGSAIADGVPEVLRAVREQLMRGATQIKLAAGGGVSSNFDPLDVSQYTLAELQAAVEAAADWNTYVTVHAYTPRAIQKSIQAGVRCIDHGQLLDEDTARMMAEQGVWLSIQPFLDDEDATPFREDSDNRAKQLEVAQGTDRAIALARQYGIKTAWGTDTLFDESLTHRQGAQLAKMVRWYEPVEVLRMATSVNAELLALSGPRNPYPGPLGVVSEGALADLLLVAGNPLEDIQLIADPERNFLVIMKDGMVYRNALAAD